MSGAISRVFTHISHIDQHTAMAQAMEYQAENWDYCLRIQGQGMH